MAALQSAPEVALALPVGEPLLPYFELFRSLAIRDGEPAEVIAYLDRVCSGLSLSEV